MIMISAKWMPFGVDAVDINDYTVYVTSCTNGNDKR